MNKKLQSHMMQADVLISKVNNRLQASLRTLKCNRYITINGRKTF